MDKEKEEELKSSLRHMSEYWSRHYQANGIDAVIPSESTHPSAIEARKHTALARAASTELVAAGHIQDALVHWKDYMFWDDAIKGAKFKPGKPKGAIGLVAEKIKAYLAKHPEAKPPEVWDALKKSPPKKHSFMDTAKLGKYIENDGIPVMEWRRFCNLVSEHRPKE